jgi:hypothetical protein
MLHQNRWNNKIEHIINATILFSIPLAPGHHATSAGTKDVEVDVKVVGHHICRPNCRVTRKEWIK